jgi:hypothetical protein
MDKTDSKVRLFLELFHPRQIQILGITPIVPEGEWNPEIMYSKQDNPYYYAFINDKKVIDNVKEALSIHQDVKNKIKCPFEFNGYTIEEEKEKEEKKSNIEGSENQNSDNNDISDKNKINENGDEEKYVVFCRFHLKDFDFIHKYVSLQKKDIERLKGSGQKNPPIIYSLKGKIKDLIEKREKNLESKKEGSHISHAEDDKNVQKDNKDLEKQKEDDENEMNEYRGIPGHWFYVNSCSNVDFLSLIKYKEVVANPENQNQEKVSDDHSSVSTPSHMSSKIVTVNTNNNIINNLNAIKNGFEQPQQYFIYHKDYKKFSSIYQNKSCTLHHNKNEFLCKTCDTFCCVECFESKSKNNIHYGHKVVLLDEAINKMDENIECLRERVDYLKTLIFNEINEKKNEISLQRNKNKQIVEQINEENEKIKDQIKKQEIERAKVLAFLGSEALRIIGDYNLKYKYLRFLNDKGDMNSYLINYFTFEKIYKREIKKNLETLEKKIKATDEKFKSNDKTLSAVIEDLNKTFK